MVLKRRTQGISPELVAPSSSADEASIENSDRQQSKPSLVGTLLSSCLYGLRVIVCIALSWLTLFYVLPACSVAMSHVRINASFDGFKHRARVVSSLLASDLPAPLASPEVRVLSSRPAGPPVWYIANFMSQHEVDYVLQSYEPYLAPNIGGLPSLLRPFVGCLPDWFGRCLYEIGPVGDSPSDPILAAIGKRIEGLLPSGIVEEEAEWDWQIAKYTGAHQSSFPAHHDNTYEGPVTITSMVYLNTIQEGGGGHTIFPMLDLDIRPKAGSLLMWSNCDANGRLDFRTLHGGMEPADDGHKYILNRFFDPEHISLRWCPTLNDPGLELNLKGWQPEI
mmetsp:Transcript_6090/g.12644  ORF Transcript_6090/g.12644 Transcript_6090/m.12644 type:complete len:336 (-) Transcript_6090:20-1027(-)|eukprot:CAMPEP_0197548602 /NCGR_PEP_ID=MMETSP1320-20131121/2682_1 /TAXON_ID=91990 /ORGANISM="Bolidomonas sp., Strain RCC2347" /LENGTH=335 /DNA_ID=CAMNT_0043108649 /DNA_START=157 /DNA_END=1164 /DNA_ORIENTATION=+